MKVDICLSGDGFRISEFKKYLDKTYKFKYKIEVIQELNELRRNGPNKGKPSKFGICWINGITVKQLGKIDHHVFRSHRIDKIAINIKEKDITSQTCLYIDSDLIHIASKIGACIEITNFKK